ncbi:MAG: c-type cytochrome [Deltaproteobacteria bacterium]|nr:c-type cytochrome [Deltaproteobacteria bacterium]
MRHGVLKSIIVGALVLAAILVFIKLFIPEVTPAPPPKPYSIKDPGEMTIVDLLMLGESTFRGRGSCVRCHDAPGDRAPSLKDILAISIETVRSEEYKGKATDGWAYVLESLIEPDAYIVKGYGKEKSPMPKATRNLSDIEIKAVIAYLKKRSGLKVDLSEELK